MTRPLAAWLDLLEKRHPRTIDLGLERCSAVFKAMGSPQPAQRVLTVAGTNGKGSTVAYLSTLLQAHGLSCGTYTSPHLLDFNERIVLNGTPVTDGALTIAFERVEAARAGVSLTYFEFTTLAAFHIMEQARLDTAVLEVGLGGRLDTVNLVDADICLITPVGLDHQQYLGDDRESIGYEKAGVLRPAMPLVCTDRQPPASITRRALELDAPVSLLGRDFDWEMDGARLLLRIEDRVYPVARPGLAGRHQLDNYCGALFAAQWLLPTMLDDPGRWAGPIEKMRVRGRLTRLEDDSRWILDVGHNPMAAQAVAACLEAFRHENGRVYCILGMLKDKDAEGTALELAPQVDHWLCAGLDGPRGQSGAQLLRRVGVALPAADCTGLDSVTEAVARANRLATEIDLVVVFGSFETVAAALRELNPDPGATGLI